MRLVPSALRRRSALFVAVGAAIMVAVGTALVLNTSPAAATWQSLAGTPTCDCVVKDSKTNTYRAVFGYDSESTSAGHIAAGDNNRIELTGSTRTTAATPTVRFEPGTHRGSFATGWVAMDTAVTWRVGGKTVTATWNRPTCGKDVSLPAGGNGSGPLVALGVAAIFAGGTLIWRRRRAGSQ